MVCYKKLLINTIVNNASVIVTPDKTAKSHFFGTKYDNEGRKIFKIVLVSRFLLRVLSGQRLSHEN